MSFLNQKKQERQIKRIVEGFEYNIQKIVSIYNLVVSSEKANSLDIQQLYRTIAFFVLLPYFQKKNTTESMCSSTGCRSFDEYFNHYDDSAIYCGLAKFEYEDTLNEDILVHMVIQLITIMVYLDLGNVGANDAFDIVLSSKELIVCFVNIYKSNFCCTASKEYKPIVNYFLNDSSFWNSILQDDKCILLEKYLVDMIEKHEILNYYDKMLSKKHKKRTYDDLTKYEQEQYWKKSNTKLITAIICYILLLVVVRTVEPLREIVSTIFPFFSIITVVVFLIGWFLPSKLQDIWAEHVFILRFLLIPLTLVFVVALVE